MAEFSIRRATGADYEALCGILAEVDQFHCERLPGIFQAVSGPARSREYLDSLLQNPEALVLLAEAGDQAVGCLLALLRPAPPAPILVPRLIAFIDTLAVLSVWRRQGIGRALMDGAHNWAREHGADDLELNVFAFNEGAVAFYRSLGYEVQAYRMARHCSA